MKLLIVFIISIWFKYLFPLSMAAKHEFSLTASVDLHHQVRRNLPLPPHRALEEYNISGHQDSFSLWPGQAG